MQHKTEPRVSVIMAVYNEERFISETIESILTQTFTDFEFIIINDGSTDKTARILETHQDPRIRIITHHRNKGLVASLNHGCQVARGEYLARIDGHDTACRNRLEKQVHFLDTHQDIGMVGSWYTLLDPADDSPLITIQNPQSPEEIHDALMISPYTKMCHVTILFRKKDAENIGFYREAFSNTEDLDFFLRFSEQFRLANIPESLVNIRLAFHNSASLKKKAEQEQFFRLARSLARERRNTGKDPLSALSSDKQQKYIQQATKTTWPQRRKATAEILYRYASLIYHQRKSKQQARRWIVQSITTYPFLSRNAWRLSLTCLLPEKTVTWLKQKKHLFRQACKKEIILGYYSNPGLEHPGGGEHYLRSLLFDVTNRYKTILFCPNQEMASFLSHRLHHNLTVISQKTRASETNHEKSIHPVKKAILHLWRNMPEHFGKNILCALLKISQLTVYFKRSAITILHINAMNPEAIIAARLAKIPIVIATSHLLPFPNEKRSLFLYVLRSLASLCLDHMIYVSEATRKAWTTTNRGWHRKNSSVIYPGIPIDTIHLTPSSNSIRDQITKNMTAVLVSVNARLYQMKGHAFLIDAIPEVLKKIPEIFFLFLGDGPCKQALLDQAQSLGVRNHIQFKGHVKNPLGYIQACDIALLPSIFGETVGLSNLEAMACAKPVIATNVGGISEIIKNASTGIIVPPASAKALAQALITLGSDKQKRISMGKKGKERVTMYFSEKIFQKNIGALYEKILNEKGVAI